MSSERDRNLSSELRWWYGAAPNRFMVHIAMQQNDESGNPVTWGEHVTDEQYGGGRSA